MTTAPTTETELRHAVIDRLIAASLRDISPGARRGHEILAQYRRETRSREHPTA